MGRSGVGVLTLLMALAGALPASAQRLRGRLLDVESGEPLVAGFVSLLSLDGTTLVTAVSDREGQWLVVTPAPGSYYVAAKRVGYRPWVAGPVAVQAGDDLNAVYHLQRLPVTLDPVEVTAQATKRFLELAGFYERQRADFGHFLTPDFIERRRAVRITDLLTALPGVSLVQTGTGSVGRVGCDCGAATSPKAGCAGLGCSWMVSSTRVGTPGRDGRGAIPAGPQSAQPKTRSNGSIRP